MNILKSYAFNRNAQILWLYRFTLNTKPCSKIDFLNINASYHLLNYYSDVNKAKTAHTYRPKIRQKRCISMLLSFFFPHHTLHNATGIRIYELNLSQVLINVTCLFHLMSIHKMKKNPISHVSSYNNQFVIFMYEWYSWHERLLYIITFFIFKK